MRVFLGLAPLERRGQLILRRAATVDPLPVILEQRDPVVALAAGPSDVYEHLLQIAVDHLARVHRLLPRRKRFLVVLVSLQVGDSHLPVCPVIVQVWAPAAEAQVHMRRMADGAR